MLKQLPGWIGFGRPVQYLDPVKAKTSDVDIFITKSFRFAYQKEYRLFWRPRESQKDLPYLNVEIGSLHDCCKLIVLPETLSAAQDDHKGRSAENNVLNEATEQSNQKQANEAET